MQVILRNSDMTMLQVGRRSTLVYRKRKGHYIFHGCDDFITIQHQSRFVLLYGVQHMRIATTTLFALSSRSILLALALGADRAISMSKDCADCLRRVGLRLVKAV